MSSTATDYFLYARKSTDRDDHQVKSIEDQRSVLRAVAERHDIRIVGSFEEAESAKAPHKRPVFANMLRRIEKGEAKGILVWHVNRLYRNPFDAGTIQQHLQDGVIACIRTPDRAYFPEDNALLLAVESGMANQYVRDLRRDVGRGVKEKAKRGWWPYRPPLGYQVNAITKNVEPKPVDFELLQRAWQYLLTGAYTVPQIGAHLTKWGFRLERTKAKRERKLSRSSLYRIFSNPFYCGQMIIEGSVQNGLHQPMVSRAGFIDAQRILHKSDHIQPQKHEFAFTGFIRCGVCGCLITAERKTKTYRTTGRSQTYTYYHCTGRKGCRKLSIGEETIEAPILELVARCRPHADMIEWARESLASEALTVANQNDVVVKGQGTEERRLQSRLDAVFDMREAGEISGEEFLERKRRYDSQLRQLRTGIEEQEAERSYRRSQVLAKLAIARQAWEQFASESPVDKRQVAMAVARSYVLTLGNLEVEPDPVFDLIRTFEPSRSGPDQIGDDPTGPNSSAWRAFRANILNLIEGNEAQS